MLVKKIRATLWGVWNGCKSLIYSPACLLCQAPLLDVKWRHFCADCFVHFERVEPYGRCKRCFSAACSPEGHCLKRGRMIRSTLAVFDYEEHAEALILAFKFGSRAYLSEGIGALMALQWLEQGLPFPDLLVPCPSSPFATYKRGYAPSLLLAKTLGHLLHRPVWEGLSKEMTFLKQSQLSESERLKLPLDHITLKKDPAYLRDKQLLLIDDILTTGQTLHLSASRLLEGYPRVIDALVFAR